MRKKVLAIVLALVMVAAMLPTVAFAAGPQTIKTAKELAEALGNDATTEGNDTVKLTKSIEALNKDIVWGGSGVTLDVGDFTLNLGQSGGSNCQICLYGDDVSLTIKGGSQGKITTKGQYATIEMHGKSSLIVDGALTIENQYTDIRNEAGLITGVAIGANRDERTQEEADAINKANTGKPGWQDVTAQEAKPKTITITGATVKGVRAVSVDDGSTLTVNSGTFEGTAKSLDAGPITLMNNSKAVISGGTITGQYSGITVSNSTLEVTGGTIKATDAMPAAAAIDTAPGSEIDAVVTSAGIFVSASEGKTSNVTISGAGTSVSGKYSGVSAHGEGTQVTVSEGEINGDEVGVAVNQKATLNIAGNANVKGRYGAFAYSGGVLNVNGGTISGTTAGLGTNGSDPNKDTTTINVTGGKVTGTTAGAYLPAGKMIVTNGTIVGKAGIVVRGGNLTVTGGTVEATGKEPIQIGDAGTKVQPAAIAVDKNESYNSGKNSVTVSGADTVVKSAEGQPTVSYSEQGVTKDKVPDGEKNMIKVDGGKFMSGTKPDKSVSSYTADNTLIGDDGKPSDTLYVKAFGYGATKEEAIEGAMKATGKEKGDAWFSDWNDQTMWVVFNQQIPVGKFVIVTVTDPLGNEGIQMLCNGGSTNFAWSYLNDKQTPSTGIVSGSYSIKAEVYEGTYDEGDEKTPGAEVTVETDTLTVAAPATPDVYPAILGDGTAKQPTVNNTSVTPNKSTAVGDYFEVHFTTDGLQKTGQNGASADEKYYLGFAVVAPEKAEKFQYRKGADEAKLLGAAWNQADELEKQVTKDGEEGVAYYAEFASGAITSPWIQIRWQDAAGNTIRIDTYEIVIDEISFVVDEVKGFEFVDFGFKADPTKANEAITAASKEVNSAAADVTDAGTNTMYVVFKGTTTNSNGQKVTAVFTCGEKTNEGNITLTKDASKGGRMYFSFDNKEQVSTTEFGPGAYTVNLYAGEKNGTLIGSKSLTIYNVKFEAGEKGAFTNEDDPADVLATKDDAKNITKPAVTAPEGKVLSSWKESVDETTYTITYTAQYTTPAPVNPTPAPTATVNGETAENGSFTVSDKYAKAGDTVTVTPKADEGYAVKAVVVTDKDGKTVEVKANDDGTYSFVMPEKAAQPVTVEVTFVCDGGDKCLSHGYADVDQGDWYHEAVDYAIRNKLMLGKAEGVFAPKSITTRAEMVTVLYRLEGEPAVTEDIPFDDVPAGEWYSDAISWAAANGIVDGYGNGKFGPNDTVTREQMAVILYRYADYKGYDVTKLADMAGYTDAAAVSDWADTAMKWAVAAGIIEGKSATTLSPSGDSIRAEVATVFMRFDEKIAE